MTKKKYCEECGEIIFNRSKSAKFCLKCGSPEHRREVHAKDPRYIKYRIDYSKKNRSGKNESDKKYNKIKLEIINLLRKKYNVKLLKDIIKKIKEEES